MQNLNKKQSLGEVLRDEGIEIAVNHANAVHKNKNWIDEAYSFLARYAQSHREFTSEDVRNASNGIVTNPPDNRAWSGVIRKAIRLGIITKKGIGKAKNANVHCNFVTIWEVTGIVLPEKPINSIESYI